MCLWVFNQNTCNLSPISNCFILVSGFRKLNYLAHWIVNCILSSIHVLKQSWQDRHKCSYSLWKKELEERGCRHSLVTIHKVKFWCKTIYWFIYWFVYVFFIKIQPQVRTEYFHIYANKCSKSNRGVDQQTNSKDCLAYNKLVSWCVFHL